MRYIKITIPILILLFGTIFLFWQKNNLSNFINHQNIPSPSQTQIITDDKIVSSRMNDNTLYKLAQSKKDYKICQKIKKPRAQDLCLKLIAKNKKEENICNKINNNTIKKECYDNVKLALAEQAGNLELCLQIQSFSLQERCIELVSKQFDNTEKCNILNTLEFKRLCSNQILYNNAILNKNPKTCNFITDYINRANCLSETMNMPLESDIDNDGLTLLEESAQGTDPNNQDTDNDGFLDGDEVKHNYNPSGKGELITNTTNGLFCRDITDLNLRYFCFNITDNEFISWDKCQESANPSLQDYCNEKIKKLITDEKLIN